MNKYLILFVFTLCTISLQAQNSNFSIVEKANQHSISMEVAALSYTYVHQIKPLLNIGVKISG
ncbi:MAG: hypothetical protein B7C24_13055 [Bacteroidetes bacterium 4572_77]|nr:MAG: hypothetical protein B7C24_13055 [Bacteroidetes bacterium 4572_77]